MTVTAPTSTGRQGTATRDFLAALDARDEMVLHQHRQNLRNATEAIQADLDAILARIAAAQEAGEDLSPSWLYRERRYRTLMRRTLDELATVAEAAEAAMIQERKAALGLGRAFARQSMQTAGVDALMGDMDTDVLDAVSAASSWETPVGALLEDVTQGTATAARAALVTGVATGKGVDWIRRRFDQAMDVPRWRTETIARTESMRAFRHATQASFEEYGEHLTGWTWFAALDSRTCPACVAMHGSVHPVTATLDGHPNCRCVMVPRTPDWDDILGPGHGLPDTRPDIPTGREWLEGQSERVQKAVLGPGKFAAWKDGHISLDDLVHQSASRTWGTMRREATLEEALRSAKARGTRPPTPTPVPEPTAPTTPPTPTAPPSTTWGVPAVPQDVPFSQVLTQAREAGLYDNWPDELVQALGQKELDRALERALADRNYQNLLDDAAGMGNNPSTAGKAVRLAAARALEFRYPHGRHQPWDAPAGEPEDMATAVTRVNPHFAEGSEWQNNCTNCTTAYEARRRGVKVTANPRKRGRYVEVTPDAWNASPLEWVQTINWKDAEATILGMYPEGARGAVNVVWTRKRGAHIFNWEVVDGRVVWVDAQPGKVLTPEEAEAVGKRVSRGTVRLFRLDNRPLTDVMPGDFVSPE